MSQIQSNYQADTVALKIANSTTVSASVWVGNPTSLGLLVPPLTSSTLKVQVSNDNSTFFDVHDVAGNVLMSYPASTGGFALSPTDLAPALGYPWLQLVCGSAQLADRTFTLIRVSQKVDPLA